MKYIHGTLKVLGVFLLCLSIGCINKSDNQELRNVGFEEIKARQSGIAFSNTITISDTFNYNTFPYIYMGGGVGLGDINNDGLTDVYLTGNMEPNKLYLNKGDMKFEDISSDLPIAGDDRWYTGVTMVDINTDGWLDVYLSVSGLGDQKENQLL